MQGRKKRTSCSPRLALVGAMSNTSPSSCQERLEGLSPDLSERCGRHPFHSVMAGYYPTRSELPADGPLGCRLILLSLSPSMLMKNAMGAKR
jgi:hypothetical protein